MKAIFLFLVLHPVSSSAGCIQAVTLEVKEGNSTCIKAELSASLFITYNATSNSTVSAQHLVFKPHI